MTPEMLRDRLTAEELRTVRLALRLYQNRLAQAPGLRTTPAGQSEWDRVETLLEGLRNER